MPTLLAKDVVTFDVERIEFMHYNHALLKRNVGTTHTRLFALGAVFLTGMLLAACSAQNGGGNAFSTSPAAQSAGTPPVTVPATMYAIVKAQVAQGMRLTVAQITTQLQADPNASLMTLAKPQGLALDQLHTMLINTLQSASDQSVRVGQWTQQQASDDMNYWKQRGQADLVNDITAWFRQH
jgi:hypothetical protein